MGDPRIEGTVWVSDHPIAQRVGMALKKGLGDRVGLGFAPQATQAQVRTTRFHIFYGILRGMADVARYAEAEGLDWFELDLGYIGAGHFSGTYRISHRGTQARFDGAVQADETVPLAPWREGGAYALICPPTAHVVSFFGLDEHEWLEKAGAQAARLNIPAKIRPKGTEEPLEQALADAACVITFNSSVGWKALQQGIPAYGDEMHSTVGSWHGAQARENLDALKACNRDALFRFMLVNQLTLLDIQQGKIIPLLRRFIALG